MKEKPQGPEESPKETFPEQTLMCSYCGHDVHHMGTKCQTLVGSKYEVCVNCNCFEDLENVPQSHCGSKCQRKYIEEKRVHTISEWLEFVEKKYPASFQLKEKYCKVLSGVTFGRFSFLILLGDNKDKHLRGMLPKLVPFESEDHCQALQTECEGLFNDKNQELVMLWRDSSQRYQKLVKKYLYKLKKKQRLLVDDMPLEDIEDDEENEEEDNEHTFDAQVLTLSEIRSCKCSTCSCVRCLGKVPCNCEKCSCSSCQKNIKFFKILALLSCALVLVFLAIGIVIGVSIYLYFHFSAFTDIVVPIILGCFLFIALTLCMISCLTCTLSVWKILIMENTEYDALEERERERRIREERKKMKYTNDGGQA